jgi:hypothetical protein
MTLPKLQVFDENVDGNIETGMANQTSYKLWKEYFRNELAQNGGRICSLSIVKYSKANVAESC